MFFSFFTCFCFEVEIGTFVSLVMPGTINDDMSGKIVEIRKESGTYIVKLDVGTKLPLRRNQFEID